MTDQPVFNRYEIQRELGKGGMATVYHAIDTRFNRDVAIKVMPREFMHDRSFIYRFEREAQTIAALEHPAIVPVHDFGEQDGQPFLVMGYMMGGSLTQWIQRGSLPLEEAGRILDRVAEALDWAHSQDIIHRDVKPANILFDRHGYAYLADFGIVKLSEATAQLTGSGIVGTPAYMAPEMMDKGGLTHLIDVYALCVTLFQMLSGKPPYESDTPMGVLLAHLGKSIPDIREARPDLPESVQAVIERGMAKDPMDRCQSAGELAAAFREAAWDSGHEAAPVPEPVGLEPEPETDMPTMDVGERTPTPPASAGARRALSLPSWAWIGGISAVVIIGIIGLAAWLRGGMEPSATAESTQAEMVAAEEETPKPTISPTEADPPAAPIDESTPVPLIPTPDPARLTLAEAGVSSNADWEPYIRGFDGVEMALVPAGCFMMGSESGDSDEVPVHEICSDEPFWIDVYEVTNEQYGLASDDCRQFSSEIDQPRICTDWFDSVTHCESRGTRLPTEAEWEYAARGPDGLIYPWGNDFFINFVVYEGNNPGGTAPVGSESDGMSWVGAYDLSGNVWEWVNSLYMDYPYDPDDGREVGRNNDSSNSRVLRGGSWGDSLDYIRATLRSSFYPSVESDYNGFRCARDYEPEE